MTNDPSVSAPAPAQPTARKKMEVAPISFSYDGLAGRLSALWYSVMLLRIVTFGLYSPWGTTRLRQYVAQQYKLDGNTFVYTGTGGELFVGMLRALVILGPLFAGVQYFLVKKNPLAFICMVGLFLILYIARYTALRYRLSRLTLMGIRFSLGGSAFDYLALRLKWMIVNILTLGYMIPYADMAIRAYVLRNIRFGDFPVHFRPQAKELMNVHLITLLLAIPTLGWSRMWYRAELYRVTAKYSRVGVGIYVRTDITGRKLALFQLGNLALLVLSLGFLTPYVLHRKYAFVAKYAKVLRRLDIDADAAQAPEPPTQQTEGLDAMLGDTGFAL